MNPFCNASRFSSYEEAHNAWTKIAGASDFHTWLFEKFHCRGSTYNSYFDAYQGYMNDDSLICVNQTPVQWMCEPSDRPMVVPNNNWSDIHSYEDKKGLSLHFLFLRK